MTKEVDLGKPKTKSGMTMIIGGNHSEPDFDNMGGPSDNDEDNEDEEGEMEYPTVYLPDVPQLEKCEVGEQITLKGRIIRKSVAEDDDNNDLPEVAIEIEVESAIPEGVKGKKGKKEPAYKNDDDAIEKGLAEEEENDEKETEEED